MKIFRNPDILWREEDESKKEALEGLASGSDVSDVGTSVLFSDGIMLSLNVLGTEIWKRCDGRDLDAMVSDLMTQFDVGPETLREDTRTFLSELEHKGFIYYED